MAAPLIASYLGTIEATAPETSDSSANISTKYWSLKRSQCSLQHLIPKILMVAWSFSVHHVDSLILFDRSAKCEIMHNSKNLS